jgi:rhodanese-related sulfurtransferase
LQIGELPEPLIKPKTLNFSHEHNSAPDMQPRELKLKSSHTSPLARIETPSKRPKKIFRGLAHDLHTSPRLSPRRSPSLTKVQFLGKENRIPGQKLIFNDDQIPVSHLTSKLNASQNTPSRTQRETSGLERLDQSPLCVRAQRRGLILPLVSKSNDHGVNRVSPQTVVDVLEGKYADKVAEYHIVDCRYDYEHENGHIRNAISINRRHKLQMLFNSLYDRQKNREPNYREVVIIFHCEFSKNRGPKTYNFFRGLDRSHNSYPMLTFPQLYVMDGGYKSFFEMAKIHCSPCNYISMFNAKYEKECKIETSNFRKSWRSTDTKGSKRCREPSVLRIDSY